MSWGWTNLTNLLEIITKSIYDKLITQFPKRERHNSQLYFSSQILNQSTWSLVT